MPPVPDLPYLGECRPLWGVAGFVDVETTGLSPHTEEIVELALVLFAFDRASGEIVGIVDEYTGLREPIKPIPAAATAIHGITHAHVRGKRLDDARIAALIARAEFLVAHNAPFDRAFVERLYPFVTAKPWLCSMRGIDWRGRGFPSRGLQNLLRAHRIRVARAHRGEDDVKAALRLLATRDATGVPYFRELLNALRAQDPGAPQERDRAAPA